MRREDFHKLIKDKIVILDGAFGTEMQRRGMPAGSCPEQWVLDHPDKLITLQKEYVKAGSDIIYAATFGANRLKLAEYGLGDQTVTFNTRIASLAKEAVGNGCLVAGDISATGCFIKPLGDVSFESVVDVYKEQVRGLLDGGVDCFVIETMIDIQEARAALLAVKETCDLPVCVSMTFNEDGQSLTGTDPLTALITLQSMGADAFGCNCSTGPQNMVDLITAIKPFAKIPLLAKPNAGLPRLAEGKTCYEMGSEEFVRFAPLLVQAGVNLIGGCCGTSPKYIAKLNTALCDTKPVKNRSNRYTAVTSSRKYVLLGRDMPLAIVGERINPTGKKRLQMELASGKTAEVRRLAMEQIEQGATILDVNVGMPGIDERATMQAVVELLSTTEDTPLCIDSSTPEVMEAALRIYPGRALVNSISAESVKLKKMLPIVAKYGGVFIALPLDDAGIPEKSADRFTLVKRIFNEASHYGYTKDDMVVDGLVMTVSAAQEAALETLKVIDWASHIFGVNTIVGLSNVSFGLPERAVINGAFLAMAIANGLTLAIANPAAPLLMELKLASEVLVGKDAHSLKYLERFGNGSTLSVTDPTVANRRNVLEQTAEAVVNGTKEVIVDLLKEALQTGIHPSTLVEQYLIPAINRVGELFEKKQYFLPQLIQSAETMKQAFEYLEPLLAEDNQKGISQKAKVVLATVKGDVHDIGKNLVALMLKNSGFQVLDLGKDVAAEVIVKKAKEWGADIIGLSALMTTTMVGMKDVIRLARQEGVKARFMVGGAVVDETFAGEIGADGYASDAYRAVKLAEQFSE